jgi:hypothetical protein
MIDCAGHMSKAQIAAISTAQNVLGWSRTRFWDKPFLLSDLALFALAELDALLVGESTLQALLLLFCLQNGLNCCLQVLSEGVYY